MTKEITKKNFLREDSNILFDSGYKIHWRNNNATTYKINIHNVNLTETRRV